MVAKIDPVNDAWIALDEQGACLVLSRGEAAAIPNFIEAARVAVIALAQIAAANAEPAGDPDVDGVGLGQGPWRARVKRGRPMVGFIQR